MKKKHALVRRILRRVRSSAVHTDPRAKKAMRRMAKRWGLNRAALKTAVVHPVEKQSSALEKRPGKINIKQIRKIIRLAGRLRLTGGRRPHR